MKFKYIIIAFLLSVCANAQAEWFLRGTQNAWGSTQMIFSGAGTNTMKLDSVVFTVAGSFKVDRFGDWKESYGVGGFNGSNIPVAAGTWKIEFFTDTKNYKISPVNTSNNYHLRGTQNAWVEGDLFTAVAGSTTDFEICRNFTAGDAAGGSRFRVDPNGGWGADAFPAADQPAAGWTKIIITGTGTTKTLKSTTINLDANCVPVTGNAFHLRGTHNAWAEGDLFTLKAGSSTNYEICRNFTAGDANGGPRFKVDLNGGWGADAFPAVDQAAAGWTKIEITTNSNKIVSTITNLGVNCDVSPPVNDFRARTIYFMFVDRFFDGDPRNNKGNNAAATSEVKSAGDISQWKKYWGGDIAGIIAKLDYLEDLGVTAIWVTPLMDNVGTGSEGYYHGYQAVDFYSVDEHLGDWGLVDTLNAEMERRGMKLVLDIALNHSNHFRDNDKGLLLKEGQFVTDWATGKGNWYHNFGTIKDCGAPCENDWDVAFAYRNKMLYDLADFNHGLNANSDADNYLIGAALKWMEHGVDAFRIDAIKHIEPNFVNRFTAAVRAKKADTYIFGEWYGAGASDSVSMQFLNENRGSELLDFKLRDSIENAIAGNSTMIDLSNHIKSRPAAMKDKEDLQAIFLDNHDETRTSVYLQTGKKVSARDGIGKNMNATLGKPFAEARQNMGMALVMTLPGVPVVYYGTEHNVEWLEAPLDSGKAGQDPYNREPMPSFDNTKPAFLVIKALAQLRKESIAIQRGSYAERWSTADVLIFQRQEGSDCAVVAINRGAATTLTVPNLCLVNAAYTSKVGSDVVNVTAGSGTFNLSQNEVVVLH